MSNSAKSVFHIFCIDVCCTSLLWSVLKLTPECVKLIKSEGMVLQKYQNCGFKHKKDKDSVPKLYKLYILYRNCTNQLPVSTTKQQHKSVSSFYPGSSTTSASLQQGNQPIYLPATPTSWQPGLFLFRYPVIIFF